MATTRDSRARSKGESHVPTTADHARKVFKGLENGDGAAFFEHVVDNVDWIVMMLPQCAQLHNESTTTGREKSDASSR